MIQYQLLLNDLLYGPMCVEKETRTGVNTRSISGYQFEHDMRGGFPLLTTKKMGIKSIAAELEFFIKGLSDKKWLQERGCTIWDEWANPKKVNPKNHNLMNDILSKDLELKKSLTTEEKLYAFINECKLKIQKEEPDLGRIYGVQWRDWKTLESFEGKLEKTLGDWKLIDSKGFDQLKDVIERAKKNPLDRRLLVTAWRPDELDEMALPPCHYAWQILSDGYYLDLIWIQRSVDTFLGLPYNIASYGLLLTLLGLELNLKPRRLVGQLGDTHLYQNHENQAAEQLGRVPFELPTIEILNFKSIFDWQYTDIKLNNYQYHPKIEAPIAI